MIRALLLPLYMACSAALSFGADSSAVSLETIQLRQISAWQSRRALATATLSHSDFTQLGIHTLAEALPQLPGILMRTGKRGEAYIRLRGFRQREVLLLIDDIPINAPYSNQSDLEKIPLQHIESIELVKGASSALYGAGGIGGIIRITTKKSGNKNQMAALLKAGARPDGETTSEGLALKSELSGSVNFNHIRIFSAGRYHTTEGYVLPGNFNETRYQKSGVRVNSHRHEAGGFLSLYADNESGWSADISGQLGGGRYGKPPTISHRYGYPRYEQTNPYLDGAIRTAIGKRFSPGPSSRIKAADLRLALYFDYANTQECRYADDVFQVLTRNLSHDDNVFGGLFVGRLQDKTLGQLAVALRSDVSGRQTKGRKDEEDIQLEYISLATHAGVEYTGYMSKFLLVTAGAALNYFEPAKGRDHAKSIKLASDDPSMTLSPQLGVAFIPLRNFRTFFNVSRKVRNPSLKELYEGDREPLKPEVSLNYELGAEGRFNRHYRWNSVFFYYDVENLIEKADIPNPETIGVTEITRNVPAIGSWGAEVSLSSTGLGFVNGDFGYTRLSMEEKGNPERQEMQYRPRHSLFVRLRSVLPQDIKLNMDGHFTGKQYFYGFDIIDARMRKVEMPAYFIFNANIQKQYGKRYSMGLFLRNIFDTYYEESYALPRSGRTLAISVNVQWPP